MRLAAMLLICAGSLGALHSAGAQDDLAVDLPEEIRRWFRNPDGSCVQCSIGMCGVDQNVPAAATLLWDTEFGPRERGGSYPSRVAAYSQRRGIRIYNVTGQNTWDGMKWAAATGRGLQHTGSSTPISPPCSARASPQASAG